MKPGDIAGYLFAYFTGEHNEDDEQVHFAISEDGLHWTALNQGHPVLLSTVGTQGIRDPFIMYAVERQEYVLLATDLHIHGGHGWQQARTNGSRKLIVWKSSDLIHWYAPEAIEVADSSYGCVWAPEAIWNPQSHDYIVYWAATKAGQGDHLNMYVTHTKDFHAFSQPEILLQRTENSLDLTMIKVNEQYYRFLKGDSGISIDVVTSPSDARGQVLTSPLLDQAWNVEGPAIFPLKSGRHLLLVDEFQGSGYYPLQSASNQLIPFKRLSNGAYQLPLNARHGSVLPLDEATFSQLKKFQTDTCKNS